MTESCTSLILFGATGNLASQKLFPALFDLGRHNPEYAGARIVAIGRRPYSTEEFISHIEGPLAKRAAEFPERWKSFVSQVEYYRMDIESVHEYDELASHLGSWEASQGAAANRVFYLAVSPQSYPSILSSLSHSGLHKSERGWVRIAIEKPFGHDLKSAQGLNASIHECFDEDQIYRIDHYLGKETVQNVLAFRFANGLFEPLWNAEHIDHIQVTVAEQEGIAGRGAYYDTAGAFRDLIQNHILQLVTILTMEEPREFAFDSQTDEKVKILKASTFDPKRTVFGQYEGYHSESNVRENSDTETYAMTVLEVDSPRWAGVPIYIRTGKGLEKRMTEITVQFKHAHQHLFTFESPEKKANTLTFRIQPDEGISLRLAVKTPRQKMQVQTVKMEFCYGMTFKMELPDAYERLFSDIFEGDQTLCLRDDLIEESWRLVDGILEYKGELGVRSYPRESWGPSSADEVIEREGRRWLAHESDVCNGITLD